MAEVFVSYSSEDREHVAMIVAELEGQGWTVWWDRRIEIGSSFDKSIEDAIEEADCIIVVWSRTSVESDWVRAEAAEGLKRNVLVSVLIDEVRPPLLFRQKQAVSLVDWKQSNHEVRPSLSSLVSNIETRLQRDKHSELPVSTQRAWVLDIVRNETTDDVLGPALYQAAILALEFFSELFVYPGEMDDDPEGTVHREGLDGVIGLAVVGEGDLLHLTLTVKSTKAGESIFQTIAHTKDVLVSSLGALLIEAAVPLQGHPLADRSRLEAYLADLELRSLYYAHRAAIEQKSHRWDEVKAAFGSSMDLDPTFALARSGYALACMHLGQVDECREAMAEGLSYLGNESPQQLHRFRGMYQILVAEDMDKAADEFQQVIQLSPMERSALNNLAVCRFHQLDFDTASELSSRDLELFPSVAARLENASLFALYAGRFDRALELAERACRSGGVKVAPLIPALIEAAEGRPESGLELIEPMRAHNAHSYAAYVDLLIALEDWPNATRSLEEALRLDAERQNREQLARKTLMKAELLLSSSQDCDLDALVADALELSTSTETLVSACLACLRAGRGPIAKLVNELRRKVDRKSRAYAKMARGIQLCLEGDLGEGIDQVTTGVTLMDLWPIRLSLGYLYREYSLPLDAADQFAICRQRHGEGLHALLDDVATYRYLHFARSAASFTGNADAPGGRGRAGQT